MSAQLLLVDPDRAAQDLMCLNLSRAGYAVSVCADAETAWSRLHTGVPDLLLLEWDLPGQSGMALLRSLRAQAGTRDLPLIVVSARCGEPDKIMALEAGADDYITKPFGPREMIARVHALLRRRAPHLGGAALQMGALRLDPDTHRVTAGLHQLVLGRVEFRLLHFLMHHPERVHSRSQLLDRVWGRDAFLDERTVDAHVGRLRSALQASGHQDHIETVRGSGYRFTSGESMRERGAGAAAA
ncbi:winged helix-turn-helix domain-containing protein [Massilia sp. CF038]|uniref:winged helix-turn-helix domain-containing protein n=1 Tax=Massilia sp. CF038 TaxID=1881045 RepID=UPI0009155C08|nr:winged helix-turn-helix domain-containing protein [Massilia sp. CF038]SHH14263.1 two-component system, OmpR family, phosphate regulon response regulator PhoB [Massilia sp. CF038]